MFDNINTDTAQEFLNKAEIQNSASQPYLNPYYGLYGASPTGFEYYFPYFEQNWKNINNTWSDWSEGGSALGNIFVCISRPSITTLLYFFENFI